MNLSYSILSCVCSFNEQITPFGLTGTNTVGGRNGSKIVSEIQRGMVIYTFIYKSAGYQRLELSVQSFRYK